MVPRDLLLVGVHETAVADDLLAADVEPVGPMRGRKNKPRDQVPGPRHFKRVRSPHREVCTFARLDRAEIITAEDRCASARPEPQRVARRQRGGSAARACDKQGLLDLEEEVAALVRGRAVHAEPDANMRIEQRTNGSDARAEAHVRRRAVRDADASVGEGPNVFVVQVHAVGAPHVRVDPAELLQVLDGPAAVELAAVLLLLDGLGEVRVQLQAEPPRELRRLAHQPAGHGKRRAGRDRDLHQAVLVLETRQPLGLREHVVELLRSEEHTSELQSRVDLVCRLLLEKKNQPAMRDYPTCTALFGNLQYITFRNNLVERGVLYSIYRAPTYTPLFPYTTLFR